MGLSGNKPSGPSLGAYAQRYAVEQITGGRLEFPNLSPDTTAVFKLSVDNIPDVNLLKEKFENAVEAENARLKACSPSDWFKIGYILDPNYKTESASSVVGNLFRTKYTFNVAMWEYNVKNKIPLKPKFGEYVRGPIPLREKKLQAIFDVWINFNSDGTQILFSSQKLATCLAAVSDYDPKNGICNIVGAEA